MNRRDFLKSSVYSLIGLSLPIELGASLVITDMLMYDGFFDTCCKLGKWHTEDNQAYCDVEVDTDKMWDYFRLIDSENRQWYTNDKGTTWRCGLMEFSLEEIE